MQKTEQWQKHQMFIQGSCDQRSGCCLYPFPDCLLCVCVCVSCARHTPLTIMSLTQITDLRDRRSETANIQHTNTLSAHQFNADDERGGGGFVVQNWDFWLRSLLEGHQQRERETRKPHIMVGHSFIEIRFTGIKWLGDHSLTCIESQSTCCTQYPQWLISPWIPHMCKSLSGSCFHRHHRKP